MNHEAVVLLATFEPQSTTVNDVEKILRGMVAPTRAEPGNEIYDLYSTGDGAELRFHLFERYFGGDALAAHRDSEHYKSYRAAIGDLLASDISVLMLTGLDVT